MTALAGATLLGLAGSPLTGDVMAQDKPAPADVAKATRAFKTGNQHYKLKQWEKALAKFEESYAAVNSPNSRLYIARCKMQLKRYLESYEDFQGTIDEGKQREVAEPKYKPTRETAEVELGELVQNHLAVVTIVVENATDEARLTIGGQEVPHDKWGRGIPLLPGEATVVMEAPGVPAQSEDLVLAAGDTKDLSFDAAPPPEPEVVAPPPPPPEEPEGEGNPLLIPAIIAGGVGVVGMGTFAIAGLMSNATFDDLEAKCGGPCPDRERENDLIDSGKTEQTVANIGLIVGAVGLATGATLFVVGMSGGGGDGADSATAPATQLEVRPGFVGVSGAF